MGSVEGTQMLFCKEIVMPAKITSKPRTFIIVWDDNQGVCVPMGWDPDCAGAVCGWYDGHRVALFADRKAARKAIDISTKWALLRRAQGRACNTDFLGACRKHLNVVECRHG